MRVLHIATTYPLHAGDSNATFVEAIAEGLAARGHECHVLVPWHPRLELERPDRRARLHAFRYSPWSGWAPWGYAQALTADRSLRWDAWVAAPLAGLATVVAARRLVARRRIDLVHAHWLVPNGPLGALARRGGARLVISCHGSGVFMAERNRAVAAAAAWASRRCAVLTACSRDLARRAGQVTRAPVEWIPYGVDPERFVPRDPDGGAEMRRRVARRHGLSAEGRWLLAVGRLVHKKGFDRLVAAMPTIATEAPDARLLIVGEGPLGDDLEAQARELGVGDRVHLVGAVPHRDLPDHYVAADLVVVPSVHGPAGNVDGLPNTLMEALASGTAVVASRVAGIPDVVRDGETGVLVPEGDVEGLADAVARLLADPERRAEIGRAARADIEESLSWKRIAARWDELYRRVAGAATGVA